MGFFKQAVEILVGSVARCHFFIIPHVIARILKRGIIAGIDPQGVHAQTLYVIKLLDDPVKVSDPIPVRIVKRLRINFVKHCLF